MRDHTLPELAGRDHIHNLLHVTILLHHIMGQGVNLQSESDHHIMTVQGAVALVQMEIVLQLRVTAGALVGAAAEALCDPKREVSP